MKTGNIILGSVLVLGTIYLLTKGKKKESAKLLGDTTPDKETDNPLKPDTEGQGGTGGIGNPPPPPFVNNPIQPLEDKPKDNGNVGTVTVFPDVNIVDANKTTINDVQAKEEVFGIDRPMPVTQDVESNVSNTVVTSSGSSSAYVTTNTQSTENVIKVGDTVTPIPDVTAGNVTVVVGDTAKPVLVGGVPTGISSQPVTTTPSQPSSPIFVSTPSLPTQINAPLSTVTYTGSAPGITLGIDGINDSPKPKSW